MSPIDIIELSLNSLWQPFILMLKREPEQLLMNNSHNIIWKPCHGWSYTMKVYQSEVGHWMPEQVDV